MRNQHVNCTYRACSSNVKVSGVNGNVIMSGWEDDNPNDEEEKGMR